MKKQNSKLVTFWGVLIVVTSQLLSGCNSGSGNDGGAEGAKSGEGDEGESQVESAIKVPESLNQAAFNSTTGRYEYAYRSIPNMYITGAPDDTDGHRWAMLHDGSAYRLYFFKADSEDTLYQFSYNRASNDYEYGFDSIDILKIQDKPDDADSSSFAMLHDGTTYRLYMRSKTDATKLYQFGYVPGTNTYQYGYNSIPELYVVNMPADADFTRWGMLHDGSAYRHYAFKRGSNNEFYQAAWNGISYVYGHNSIPQLTIENMPDNSDTSSFSMLHDGSDYRFYFQTN